MSGVQYRAYDGSGGTTFYTKDVEGVGTTGDPHKSGVVVRGGGDFGVEADTPNKDGNLLETLHYIANNLGSSSYSQNIALATVTAIGTTLKDVLDIVCADYRRLSLRVDNTGSVVLSDLQVQGFESSGFPYDYSLEAGADITGSYTTYSGKQSGNSLITVITSSGTLPALPASSKAGILLNVECYQRIRLQAKVATGTTTLQIAGTLMR